MLEGWREEKGTIPFFYRVSTHGRRFISIEENENKKRLDDQIRLPGNDSLWQNKFLKFISKSKNYDFEHQKTIVNLRTYKPAVYCPNPLCIRTVCFTKYCNKGQQKPTQTSHPDETVKYCTFEKTKDFFFPDPSADPLPVHLLSVLASNYIP